MSAPRPVGRRCVLYVSGFDPKGPIWYYGLYKRNAAAQAKLSGMTIAVGPRRRAEPHLALWDVEATENGQKVHTDYLFARWDDIMRRHWPKGIFALYGTALANLRDYIGNGVLLRVYKTAWPTFNCAFYPSLFLFGVALALLLAAFAVARLATVLLALPLWLALTPALAAAAFAGRWIVPRLDRRFALHWLTRIYAFTRIQAIRGAPDLDTRLGTFADLLIDKVRCGDYDEVLLVGHSTGGQTAVSLLARALAKQPDLATGRTALSFLTLGSSIAMLGWQPEADWFRADLKRVSGAPGLVWTDFTAAQDGACFALRDQVALSLGEAAPEPDRPKVLSIKLFDLFSEQAFAKIRRNWFRVHFQYLMAGEKAADYDYFAITAGALRLHDRYAHRPSTLNFDRFESRVFRP